MKKLLLLILTVFLLVSLFSCKKNGDSSLPGPPDPIGEYDETESFDAGGEKGAFTVRVKKFIQGDANVAVLRIENNSSSDYDVTVTGTFSGEDGEVFATKTASLSGFSAGAGNFCILEPGAAFDTLDVSLETAPCTEAYLKYFAETGCDTVVAVDAEIQKLYGIPESEWDDILFCKTVTKHTYYEQMEVSIIFGIYRENGEYICSVKNGGVKEGGDFYLNLMIPFQAEYDGETYSVPESLRGDLKYFYSVESAVPWDGTMG